MESWPPRTPAPCGGKRGGVVEAVSAARIIVRADPKEPRSDGQGNGSGVDIYTLMKFRRSNQNTCINQKPIVAKATGRARPGDRGRAATSRASWRWPERPGGLHALGRLQLRGRHPHQRAAGEGRPVHLDPHRRIRDRGPRPKLGKEEITRDIPNVGKRP